MAECADDKDMLEMANEDLGRALEEEKRLQNLLLKSLLPRDDADERDCILEVRAGNKCRLRWALKCELLSLFLLIIFSYCLALNLTKKLIRNWWRGGFFVCNGCV